MPETALNWAQIHQRTVPAHNEGYRGAVYASRRSVVFSTKVAYTYQGTGIVASSQPLANECGLEILRRGGNAADAAVAVAAALNVTEPCSTGIGGDAFCLFWDAKTKRMHGLNGCGKSPKALTLERAREAGFDENHFFIPAESIHSATVPGTAACWIDTVKSFGSRKMTLGEVLEPAARLAENGFPVSEITAAAWQLRQSKLKAASENAHEMLVPDGNGGHRAPKAGEIKENPELARTFRELGEKGFDGFYKGRIADAIVELCRQKGGLMTLEDLATHSTLPVEPISYTYQGEVTLHELPPNGQGLAALIALGVIDVLTTEGKINLEKMQHNSAEYLHVLIEAVRIAFSDARAFISDPDHARAGAHAFLTPEYLGSRAKLFDPKHVNDRIICGEPIRSSDTVYFTCSDQNGNVCSFIQSNYQNFGTGAIPKGCGFTLQNRGTGFVLEPGHPNSLAGAKRPYHTIIPAMATRKGELFMSFGVMGGNMQPQGHLQVLLNTLHQSFTIQQALDAPRFCVGEGFPKTKEEALNLGRAVQLEEGIAQAEIDKLREMGHNISLVRGPQRGTFGRGQIIMPLCDERTGRLVWAGASDSRCVSVQLFEPAGRAFAGLTVKRAL